MKIEDAIVYILSTAGHGMRTELDAMNNIVFEGKVRIRWEGDEPNARPKFVVN